MVFSVSKRRVRVKLPNEANTTFLDLPDELLLAILERTNGISEVLRLRQTNKILVPACNSIIQDKLKTLYVHPAKRAVERAIAICKSDWAFTIEQICFVNEIQRDLIRTSGKKYGLTWPSLGQKRALSSDVTAKYETLFSSLGSLPNVKSLSFKETCDESGYNMISKQMIDKWAHAVEEYVRTWDPTVARRKPNRLQQAEAKLYGPASKTQSPPTAKQGFNFTDLDAIVAVLPRLNITSLKLSEELPFGNERTLATTSLGHLTHIELLVHLGWTENPWQRFCHELLRTAAPTLQSLKLSFQYNRASEWRRRVETSLATLVNDTDFPKLRSLELCALQLPDEVLYVPQIIDFMAFLSRCKELKLLRTSGIFPTFVYILMQLGQSDYPSMDGILSDFEGEARVLEEFDENSRAWEISVPSE